MRLAARRIYDDACDELLWGKGRKSPAKQWTKKDLRKFKREIYDVLGGHDAMQEAKGAGLTKLAQPPSNGRVSHALESQCGVVQANSCWPKWFLKSQLLAQQPCKSLFELSCAIAMVKSPMGEDNALRLPTQHRLYGGP